MHSYILSLCWWHPIRGRSALLSVHTVNQNHSKIIGTDTWGLYIMAAISQTSFANIFPWKWINVTYDFIEIYSRVSYWWLCTAGSRMDTFKPLLKTMLTDWGRDKMAVIFQTKFSNAFLIQMHKCRLRFHWSLFLRVQLTIPSIGSDYG